MGAKMNTTEEIMRYLFLGTAQPYFIYKNKPLNIQIGCRVFEPIKTLVDATDPEVDNPELREQAEKIILPEDPLKTIVKAMKSGYLVRHDECLFGLAYLARTYKKHEDKHKVYEVVPELIVQGKDLFQFAYFYKILKHAETKTAGFGHGMKVALTKWYDKHSAEELAKLLAMDRGAFGWTHRDLLRQAHVDLEDNAKAQILRVVKGAGQSKKAKESAKKPKDDKAQEQNVPQVGDGAGQSEKAKESAEKPKDDKAQEQDVSQVGDGAGQSKNAKESAKKPKDDKAQEQNVPQVGDGAGQSEKAKESAEKPKDDKAQEQDVSQVDDGAGQSEKAKESAEQPKDDKAEEQKDADPSKKAKKKKKKKAKKARIDDGPQVDSEALKLYNKMKKFKALDDAERACHGIQEQNYPFELVPVRLLRAPNVWESLFPHLAYRTTIRAAVLLQDFRLLKENESPLSVAYGKVLNRMKSVRESKLNPIIIYRVMRLFEERQRYHNAVKEAVHSSNNMTLRNSNPNPVVLQQFYAALNESMLNYQKTGLRFMVTLDLRSKQSKKRVFGNRLMSCQAATILLTLPIIKREEKVTVLSFTDNENKLNSVNISRDTDFFKACDQIQNLAVKKTKANIARPIEYATEQKMPVDVFITIVDSLIRVNPKRKSPVAQLQAYNTAMKQQARCIFVNLSRHRRDLDHADMDSTMGVLEIAGCPEEAPKLIDAYVNHYFV